ncbi:TetR-like C-terminal domain-containing protein [Streptomyces sp. NPDC054766]
MFRRSALIRSVAAAAEQNSAPLRAVRDGLVQPLSAALERMLRRAIGRGEIDRDRPGPAFVPPMSLGPVMVHDLLDRQEPVPVPVPAALASHFTAVSVPALSSRPPLR